MTKYHCQPAFYTDRSDNWEVDAESAHKAAERFQAIYNHEQCEWQPETEVRVMHLASGLESIFTVAMYAEPVYTAKEKK